MNKTIENRKFFNTIILSNWNIKKHDEIAFLINGRAYKKEDLLLEGKYKVI